MHRFRDWENLPPELVENFRDKMDLPGLLKFGHICSSWRSISSPFFKSMLESILIIQDNSYENGTVWIYNPSDGIPYQVRLPPGFTKGKICGFTNGCLVLEEENRNSNLQLLRLFSSDSRISLLPPFQVEAEAKKICLSKDHSMAMAIARNRYSDENVETFSIFVCSPKQDRSWKLIQVPHYYSECRPIVEDVIFSKGKFYAITSEGLIIIVQGSPFGAFETSAVFAHGPFTRSYLAESSEHGFIFVSLSRPLRYNHFLAKSIEIDEHFEDTTERIQMIDDIGDNAVFVGCNHTRIIPTLNSPGLKKNMVYTAPDPRRRWKGELVYADGKPCALGGRSLLPDRPGLAR